MSYFHMESAGSCALQAIGLQAGCPCPGQEEAHWLPRNGEGEERERRR